MRAARKKLLRFLPNVLIGIGAAMILVFGIYEGIHYPWMALLSKWGWVDRQALTTILPDPVPLGPAPVKVLAEPAEPPTQPQEDLPAQPNWELSRPSKDLTWLGVIKLPTIQISENVVEGIEDELLYAVGHAPGTALPGQEGNCFLAGHRNYVYMRPFRYLDKIEVGDPVFVSDDAWVYEYEVYEIFEVTPEDVWVLSPVEGESHVLTLMTCTPVMNPVYRLIARARLVNTAEYIQG